METPITTTEVPVANTQANNQVNIDFKGTGWGYYRIFITNSFLNIVTFGIYSAWAKVRTKRFFYGHTFAGLHNFEFDANPITILISRLIIVGIFTAAFFLEEYYDIYWQEVGIISLALLVFAPFAMVRGRAFNLRHSIHRTVRFRYDIIYKPTLYTYLIFLVSVTPFWLFAFFFRLATEDDHSDTIVILEFVLLAISIIVFLAFLPYVNYLRHSIQINQLNFGKLKAKYTASIKDYYVSLGGALLFTVSFWLLFYIIHMLTQEFYVFPITFVVLIIGYYMLKAKFSAIYWSSIRFDDGSYLTTTLNWKTYLLKILLPNFFLIVITFGTLYPWAVVRNWRYVAKNVFIHPSEETLAILSTHQDDLTPLASEFGDIDGLDLDFGVI